MLTEINLPKDRLNNILLARELEEFLYREADTIDSRNFVEWLDYFDEDIRYWVPIRKNLPFNQRFADATDEHGNAWIDDTRATLEARIYQVMTKIHWAEEPLSRVSHIVSNVFLDKVEDSENGESYVVKSKLIVYRSRMEEAGEMIVAKREDKIRRTEKGLKIYWRKILLDQATLHAKNLSFFL